MQPTTARILAAGIAGVAAGAIIERVATPGALERHDAHVAEVERSNLGEPARQRALDAAPARHAGLKTPLTLGASALGVAALLGIGSAMNFMFAGQAIGSLAKGSALVGVGLLAGAGASYALR